MREPEIVSISANERSKIQGSTKQLKLKCFKPSLESGRYELSSFDIGGLEEHEAWEILDRNSNKAPVPARADLTVESIRDAELAIHADGVPERHVNILGWPPDEAGQASRAQVLFNKQKCKLRNSSTASAV